MNPSDWQSIPGYMLVELPGMALLEDSWVFDNFQCTSKTMKGNAYDKILASVIHAIWRDGR